MNRPSPITDVAEPEWQKVPAVVRTAVEQAFKDRVFPVLMAGRPGTGKTWSMAAAFRQVKAQPRWIKFTEFCNLIGRCRRDGSIMLGGVYESFEGDMWRKHIAQPPILFVDDVGIRKPTEMQVEVLYEILERRKTRPLILSSNMDREQLSEQFSEAVLSRLMDGTVLAFTGEDKRKSRGKIITVTE